MGQQRGLHGLEEHERRAGDEQHVEGPAGQPGPAARRLDDEHGAADERLLGELDREGRAGEAGVVAQPSARSRGGAGVAGEPDARRRRSESTGATAIPSATATAPEARPTATPTANSSRHIDSENTSSAVEPVAAVPGQPAARQVGAGVGHRGHEADRVQRLRAVEGAVLQRAAQRHARARGRARPRRLWTVERGAQRMAFAGAAGDPAREQLLDRAVEHGDRDRDHRPQQRDARVGPLAEHVGRDAEVGEGDEVPVAATPMPSTRAAAP